MPIYKILYSEDLVDCKFKSDLILTASLEGTLRMFHVILHPEEDANSTANNMLLETNLKLPILQVAVGNFSRLVLSLVFERQKTFI